MCLSTGCFPCFSPILNTPVHSLVPISVKASVLDRVILPCYWNTMKDKAQFQWNMKDQMVLHFEDGKLTMGKDFEERFFYSEEGYWEGNLSLIINQVCSSDEGLYRCFVNKDDKGYPHSYILSVENVPYYQNIYFYTSVVLALPYGCMFIFKVFSHCCKKLATNVFLKSVRVSLPNEDLSSERKPLNSHETNPHKSKLKRRSKGRPNTWSGNPSIPSLNAYKSDEK
uniref:Ig-like domain-containing protein n=1 Tax=Astyanax mexicanus TaxID=7994 RepID=A0A8B9RBF6_ASTMX